MNNQVKFESSDSMKVMCIPFSFNVLVKLLLGYERSNLWFGSLNIRPILLLCLTEINPCFSLHLKEKLVTFLEANYLGVDH